MDTMMTDGVTKEQKRYDFFAFLARMKYINRWGLMRNTQVENIQEHSLEVALIAHALVLIKNEYFGGSLSPERAALYGMFHDTSEVFTGDMPTPVKHFSQETKDTFHALEDRARERLLSMLPGELSPHYRSLLFFETMDQEYRPIIKAADKIAALIKCLEEEKSGNREFRLAGEEHLASLKKSPLPEVCFFVEKFLPGYGLSLDELNL